jgi:hypothetical protein
MDSTYSPEKLRTLLFPWRQRRAAEQAAGELARHCRAELWRRIWQHAAGMSPAELRGYARARAAGLVAAEADRLLGQRRLRPAMRGHALATAVDQAVKMAVRDALGNPPPENARTIAA